MTAPDLLAPIRARAEAATPGPWFLNDCEGEIIVLPEADLVSPHRDEGGRITSWGLPTSYRPERRILELELDSWDEGEDEQDDQVRANSAFIAHAREDVPALLAALDAVLALHQSNGGGHHTCKCGLPAGAGAHCIACRKPWPCQTVAAVSAALGGGE